MGYYIAGWLVIGVFGAALSGAISEREGTPIEPEFAFEVLYGPIILLMGLGYCVIKFLVREADE